MWTPRANSSSSRSIPRPGASGGGCAAVYGGGMWQVIDSTGAVRLELPGVDSVTIENGSIEAGGQYYSTATFEPAVFYGYTGVPIDGGFWVKGRDGRQGLPRRRQPGLFLRGRGAPGPERRAVAGAPGRRLHGRHGRVQPRRDLRRERPSSATRPRGRRISTTPPAGKCTPAPAPSRRAAPRASS